MSGSGEEARVISKRAQGASILEPRELSTCYLSPTLSEKIPTFPTKSSAMLHVPRNSLEPPTPGCKTHVSRPLLDRGAAWPVCPSEASGIHRKHS